MASEVYTPATVINQLVERDNLNPRNEVLFIDVMEQFRSSFIAENRREPTNSELRAHGVLMLSGIFPERFAGSGVAAYTIILDPPEVVDSNGILLPVSERQLIVLGLLEAGRNVTAENMQAVFNATQQGE